MAKTFSFTIEVVGTGEDVQAAWEDAKQSAEQKVADDVYDKAVLLEEN